MSVHPNLKGTLGIFLAIFYHQDISWFLQQLQQIFDRRFIVPVALEKHIYIYILIIVNWTAN